MRRIAASAAAFALAVAGPTRAEELTPEVRAAVDNGLRWLADAQHRDGHWEGDGGRFPVALTAMAGLAMLMEGSTLREGKHADHLRRAVDWLTERVQPTGLIGNPNNAVEAVRYMYGHGFGMLFLACVYGEEEDGERRKRLEAVLTRAVVFCGKAQTERGGWGYLTAADDGGFDEGSVTITQLQALRAAKNAGIVVPKSIVDKAVKYLRDCTTPRGGVIYSLTHGQPVSGAEKPALTAAAVACSFAAGEYDGELAKKWLKYCQAYIPVGRGGLGHDEYLWYYLSQAVYVLGEDGYARLFPESRDEDRLKWGRYREAVFAHVLAMQNRDGSWDRSNMAIGPAYCTAAYLTVLQLDRATLPVYQR